MNPSDCRICRAALAPSEPHFVVEIHEETMVDGAATVHDAWTAMHLCRTCADAADFDRLASPPPRVPDDADARAVELADAYAAALGEPESVLHPSESSWPHVDVYLYRPGRLAPGWISVTAGRALVPLEDGRRVEIVQHLAPQEEISRASARPRRCSVASRCGHPHSIRVGGSSRRPPGCSTPYPKPSRGRRSSRRSSGAASRAHRTG